MNDCCFVLGFGSKGMHGRLAPITRSRVGPNDLTAYGLLPRQHANEVIQMPRISFN
jgi:hypothetical protein